MAPKKPLTGFTTPLGSGAGVPLEKRPPKVTDSEARLAKPFRVPFKEKVQNVMRRGTKRVNYAEAGEGKENEPAYSEEDNVKRGVRLGARPSSAESSTQVLSKRFVVPLKSKDALSMQPPPPLGTRRAIVLPPRPLHDPTLEFAIVLYDPTVDSNPDAPTTAKSPTPEATPETEDGEPAPKRRKQHKSLAEMLGIVASPEEQASKYPDVPVVIDPKLAKILRPHQVAGVKFLYRCTAGLVDPTARGCIMADEMGLGKTLQCIALMWTLLKQSPRGRRTIDKCIIVCPSSLVRNWANEIVKWLGEGVLTPFAVDGGKGSKDLDNQLVQWATAHGRNIIRPVLIISYETLRRNVDKLAGTEVGLMLADEGHRLKNGDSLTFTALNQLKCPRRVILSGTPIQNDLSEYFSLLNFANPGYLGTRADFRKNFENAILRGRDGLATDQERAKGDEKLAELLALVNKFIIRRTNDILSKYLPIKYEYVLFVDMAPMQKRLYRHFITSPVVKKLLKGVGSQPLKAIGMLKKLATHPDLLKLPSEIDGSDELLDENYANQPRYVTPNIEFSGKFVVLERFLGTLRQTTDRIVIISNYTQTLDVIQRMCYEKKYRVHRLDGSLGLNKRQKIVDEFNDPLADSFVFLLSSKAGGCGINLIGANRLILMDPDWNPASDQQALARVWRDGQKKDCFIYRFIGTGTIEEKIFQRQSMKMSLSSCVVDEKEDVERLFSGENLRELFKYTESTVCDTHDTYKCKRCTDEGQKIKAAAMLYGDQTTWNHFNNGELAGNQDLLIQNEAQHKEVTFAFQYISHLS
ncbi:DNA repair and recombination protein Rad54p [Diutina catenulata]